MNTGILSFALFLSLSVAESELQVFPKAEGSELSAVEPQQMLNHYLRDKVDAALDERLERYEALGTSAEIKQYQEEMRRFFIDQLGGFPERSPLNAQVTGEIEGDGYHVKKVIYESLPGHPVTALLYLPTTDPPYPGVLHPCGHASEGKAAETYQRASILMARNGLAVLCFDPLGQGERKQLLGGKGGFGATTEHMYLAPATILLGQNVARYMIWDGIRGIDYLVSRDDIDETRIGCVGNSGGGMMTSYLMALDERISAAAPACFITTTRRKNVSPGPGDAEQNIHAQTAYGMDHADYILMRAPKPTLIASATRDFVPIEGAWESFRQAKRLYTRMGFSERVDLIEADETHGFSEPLRVGVTRWMLRWLLGIDEPITEEPVEPYPTEDLWCTPEGQVLEMDDVRSIHDLYREAEAKLAERRGERWDTLSPEEKRNKVRQLAGIRSLHELERVDVSIHQISSEDFGDATLERLILVPQDGIFLPALRFVPEEPAEHFSLYVDGDGKGAGVDPDGPIGELIEQGHTVLAVDLRGYGETQTDPWRYQQIADSLGPNSAEFFVAYMLGHSLVGMRAEDVLTAWRVLEYSAEQAGSLEDARFHLVGVGHAGVPALHAAALEPELFGSVELRQALDSWGNVVRTDELLDGWQLENTVHGALRYYDLPDLRRLLGVDRLTVHAPRDAANHPLVQDGR